MAFQVLLSRVINFSRIITGYFLSVLIRRPVNWGFPLAVSIEPNNTCNLRCPECPSGVNELTRSRGNMGYLRFVSILDQLSPALAYLTLYFQVEPYLNPSFFDFIHYARSRKIFVSASTNGHFLGEENIRKTVESGLDRLIISLDGPDQESYSAYRVGGNFRQVLQGIRSLVDEKHRVGSRNPKIILQCLLLRSNENRLKEIRKLGKELGVDKVVFKTAQFNDYQQGHPMMPENRKYSRYYQVEKKSPEFKIKNPLPNRCFRMWSGCVFTWDGKVVPCCFDKDAQHILGDLNSHTFAEIWKSGPYQMFRGKILKNRKSIPICTNCTQTK